MDASAPAPAATVLVTPEELGGALIEVSGASYRHLFRSLRLPVGANLRVVDGAGAAREGVVRSIERRRAVVGLGDGLESLEPERHVELFVPVLRPSRVSWLIEKATELGAAAIRFVEVERAARPLARTGLGRYQRIAVAAVEQCGRARVPQLSGPHDWDETLALLEDFGEAWALVPGGDRVPTTSNGSSAAVCVGPEGGWSERERGQLLEVGCRVVDLGARTLRAETAAVAGLTRLLL